MKKIIATLLLCFTAFQLVNAQVAKTANEISPLLIGEKIPTTSVINSAKKTTTTDAIFKTKKTVLIVYRGGWCPYCTTQLKDLRSIEEELIGLGYQIVAVSSDIIPEDTKKYSSKYLLISDSSTQLIQNLGIAFSVPNKYAKLLGKASGGKNKTVLPAPAVYILNTESKILFEYISPDYTNRVDEKLLLAAAKSLQ